MRRTRVTGGINRFIPLVTQVTSGVNRFGGRKVIYKLVEEFESLLVHYIIIITFSAYLIRISSWRIDLSDRLSIEKIDRGKFRYVRRKKGRRKEMSNCPTEPFDRAKLDPIHYASS
jgi:hypothetical protein